MDWASVPVLRTPILPRSEEHTSELQSRLHLVCRLLLEKKNIYTKLPSAVAPATVWKYHPSTHLLNKPKMVSTLLFPFLTNPTCSWMTTMMGRANRYALF